MAEDGLDGALDVVGDEVVAAVKGGGGLGNEHEAEGGAGTGATCSAAEGVGVTGITLTAGGAASHPTRLARCRAAAGLPLRRALLSLTVSPACRRKLIPPEQAGILPPASVR